jgi:hypothetical protein
MRAALDGKPLTPEITRDEMTEPESAKLSSTDAELLRNVPPHHG